MSDVGIYDAIEAEIISKIGDLSSLDVIPTIPACSIDDLAWHLHPDGGGNQGRLLGLLDLSSEVVDQYTIAKSSFLAKTMWEVAYVEMNLRGAADSRSIARTVMETVRDRLHYQNSALSGAQRYMWVGEKTVDTGVEGMIGRVAQYRLNILLAQ